MNKPFPGLPCVPQPSPGRRLNIPRAVLGEFSPMAQPPGFTPLEVLLLVTMAFIAGALAERLHHFLQ